MVQALSETDDKILIRLREPIEELLEKHCINMSLVNRIRLRQLPWYAVDILIDTDDPANLKNHEIILAMINDIKQIGASQEFIDESFRVAFAIYERLQIDHPELLQKYKFNKLITTDKAVT